MSLKRNNPRSFAETVSLDAWHTPFSQDKAEADLHIDVVFAESRLGGADQDAPVRFRLNLKRAEVHVVRDGAGVLKIPPASVARVQGAFVSDQEVQQVVDFLRSFGSPDYSDSILEEPVAGNDSGLASELNTISGETDPLYDQAVHIVIETRRASVPNIQRRLGIGYNRAARLVEAMEQAQLVGLQQSNGMREVLVLTPPNLADIDLNDTNP